MAMGSTASTAKKKKSIATKAYKMSKINTPTRN
jgi:hypothetical protein